MRLEGAEEFIKQEELLKRREAQLGIKKENIQSEIEEVNTDLNYITFFKNNIYCLADTREEYEFLINEQEKATSSLEEFLNEPIDYTKVHLGVNEYDENIHNSCGKSLSKKF